MTSQRENALNQVRQILVEHFDAFTINVKITDENLNTRVEHYWHGDITDVIGLNRIAAARLEHRMAERGTEES
jgi:hypothetical protein